jgi:sepiapterin reductase
LRPEQFQLWELEKTEINSTSVSPHLYHPSTDYDPKTFVFKMSSSMLLLVTGASRGFGQALAKVACQHTDRVRAILVARSADGLLETEESMQREGVQVSRHIIDLQDLDKLDGNIDDLFQDLCLDDGFAYDNVVLINNAGTVGHVGSFLTSPSLENLRSNVDLNVTSALWISIRFAQCIKATKEKQRATIVNISSLVAIADFPTMAAYSAGKAAREKYHTIMSKEIGADDEGVKILNYAPGPLETDMVTEIRSSAELDADLRPHFDKKLLDPEDSARKLIKLLVSNEFQSGSHVDYYDLPDE